LFLGRFARVLLGEDVTFDWIFADGTLNNGALTSL